MTYRSATPYRNPSLYRGGDEQPQVPLPSHTATRGMRWRQGRPRARSTAVPFDSIQRHDVATSLPFGTATPRGRTTTLRLYQQRAREAAKTFGWAETSLHDASMLSARWAQATPHERGTTIEWGDLRQHLYDQTALPYLRAKPHERSAAAPWGAMAAHARTDALAWRRLARHGAMVALPWSTLQARSRDTVVTWPPTPPVDPDTILVPDLPVYFMLPTLEAVRLPDRAPIPLLSISLQAEQGAYDWSFTAPVNAAALDLVNPDDGSEPTIEVTVNGFVWTFAVEGYDDNRRFGLRTYNLRGRSVSAHLSAPYVEPRTYTETQARTAAQLAEQELPPGWSLVWDAVDWLVPADTWSYQDLTPVEAIAQLASSIGAALRSHPSEQVLEVVPTYRDSPWEWGAAVPYAILPAAAIVDGSSSWKGGSDADGVYVYAQHQPTGALVKLTGTDGARQLPMIVDPLLVHADAQRERGRQALAADGRARTVQRTVPLFPTPAPPPLPDLGVVPLGALLEFEEADGTWRGMVTAVRIDAQRAGDPITVRQHLTLERQFR